MQKLLKPKLLKPRLIDCTFNRAEFFFNYTGHVNFFGIYNNTFSASAYSDIWTSSSFCDTHNSFIRESIRCSLFCSFSPAQFAPVLVSTAGSSRSCFAVAEPTHVLIRAWRSETFRPETAPPCFLSFSDWSFCTIWRRRRMDNLWWTKKAGRISRRYSAPSATVKEDYYQQLIVKHKERFVWLQQVLPD